MVTVKEIGLLNSIFLDVQYYALFLKRTQKIFNGTEQIQ